MVEVKVNFDYDAEQHDELTIRVGDIIKNVSTPEGGWWEGELNGKKGLFPDNFVEVIKNPEKSKDRDKEKDEKSADTSSHRTSTKGHVAELANKLRDGVHIGGGPPKKRESLNKKKLKAKASFAYTPENDDELTIEVGDVLEILKQEEEGWWEGSLNGKIGMFPSNFVELLDENGEEAEKSDEPKKEGDFQEIKGKKVQGFGFGNIFGGGPIKLKNKGASGKKVGPPETAERKKEEKSESPTMREKSGLNKERNYRRHTEEICNRASGVKEIRSAASPSKQARAPSKVAHEDKMPSRIHIHVSGGSRKQVNKENRSKSSLKPVRCSTPNRTLSDSTQLMNTPSSRGSSMSNKLLKVSLDISSIKPQVDVRVSRPRRSSAGAVQTVRFTSPRQTDNDRDVGFVSPPHDTSYVSTEMEDKLVTTEESFSTVCLTDSMILHKKRLSSPREQTGSGKKKRYHCDSSSEDDSSDDSPSEPSFKGDNLLNKSSSSLSRFRTFVRNMFSSPPSDSVDKSPTAKQAKKSKSLLPFGKKRRWTLPTSLWKKSPPSNKNESKKRRVIDDNLLEQDSSSNNSCVAPAPGSVYQTDEFLTSPCALKTSPQTYLASLDKYGKLPPYIQQIAKRYNLLDVLDGKRKVLHSSFGHLPFKEYYFDDSRNPFLEQHDNSDEDTFISDFVDYAQVKKSLNLKNLETFEKGVSADDILLSAREVEDAAENAVVSVIFSIIQTPEEEHDKIKAPLASPESMEENKPQKENMLASQPAEYKTRITTPFSEARMKFFEMNDINLPQEDPFEKYRTHRHSLPLQSKEAGPTWNKFTPFLDRYSIASRENSSNFEEIPLTPQTENTTIGQIGEHTEGLSSNSFQTDVEVSPDVVEHNYSISLMSSFQADEEPLTSPEKYPSFISMDYDEADITAPEVSTEPSLVSLVQHQNYPPAQPDYMWLTTSWWPRIQDTENRCNDVSHGYSDANTDTKPCDVELKEQCPQMEKKGDESLCRLVAHHRRDSGQYVPVNVVEGKTDLLSHMPDDKAAECCLFDRLDGLEWYSSMDQANLTEISNQTILSESLQLHSLSKSVTVGIQVPEDIIVRDDGESEILSADLEHSSILTNYNSDIHVLGNSSLPKGFRDPWRRPSSRILRPSLGSLTRRTKRQSPCKMDSLKRPLSWMYPEISRVDLSSPSGLQTCSLNRVPTCKAEQSNRYLVIDSSSTLTSINSVRDSLCSRQSVLDGDPKLLKGSSEKRKRHRLWKRVHQPKTVNPVELISYKKVYEPGTPMYDMVPLLNRSLTGGDMADQSPNVNQNHPGLGLECEDFSDDDSKGIPRDQFRIDGDCDSQMKQSTNNTLTPLSLTPSVSNNSDDGDVGHMQEAEIDVTPVSFLPKAYGADDTLTSEGQGTVFDTSFEGELKAPCLDAAVDVYVENILHDALRCELSSQLSYYASDVLPLQDCTKDKCKDFLTTYGQEESDISFNALCNVAFGIDDDIQHDELRGFASMECPDTCKSESRSTILPDEVEISPVACFGGLDSYLHVLDDLSTDYCVSDSTGGSPLYSCIPPSARSMISADSYDTNDRSIEFLVADKSKRATQYYSLTDIQPSPSSSSTEA